MTALALITGLAATALSADERAFCHDASPWGLIIFKRNVETPEQTRRLVASFRDAVGRADAPVLVDQEGGRVQRLGPPHWPAYPAGAEFGRLSDPDPEPGLLVARPSPRFVAAQLAALVMQENCIALAGVPVTVA